MMPNVSKPPFDDVNVRIAMQKAIDLEAISETYYKGLGDPTPWGKVGQGLKGFYKPYDEWPEEAKWGYEYDPEEAERLLDEAGYPRAADGIRLKTSRDVCTGWGEDADLAQILKMYWAEVGIDVEIKMLEPGPMLERYVAGDFEMTRVEFRGGEFYPVSLMKGYTSGYEWNVMGVNDPTFDALWEKTNSATDMEDFKQWSIDLDMYVVNQHWVIEPPSIGTYPFIQPWLKGYSGEWALQYNTLIFSRTWIDQELRTQMGH